MHRPKYDVDQSVEVEEKRLAEKAEEERSRGTEGGGGKGGRRRKLADGGIKLMPFGEGRRVAAMIGEEGEVAKIKRVKLAKIKGERGEGVS